MRSLPVLIAVCIGGVLISGCRPRYPKPQVEFTLQKIAFQIGDTKIHAHVTQIGRNPLTIIQLHEDEPTCADAARIVLDKHGGRFIRLVHSGARRVTFALGGASYSFDPNRIFSEVGVERTVRGGAAGLDQARAVVREFSAQFIGHFALAKQPALVAVHNNGDGDYAIDSYRPGAIYELDTDELFINPDADPDNFFYLTDRAFFTVVKNAGHNAILQDNRIRRDDGSLSVFAGRRNIPYINVETETDQLAEQVRMLELAFDLCASRIRSWMRSGRGSGSARQQLDREHSNSAR